MHRVDTRGRSAIRASSSRGADTLRARVIAYQSRTRSLADRIIVSHRVAQRPEPISRLGERVNLALTRRRPYEMIGSRAYQEAHIKFQRSHPSIDRIGIFNATGLRRYKRRYTKLTLRSRFALVRSLKGPLISIIHPCVVRIRATRGPRNRGRPPFVARKRRASERAPAVVVRSIVPRPSVKGVAIGKVGP